MHAPDHLETFLLQAMDFALAGHAGGLAFHQLRRSAEDLAVHVAARGAHDSCAAKMPGQWRVLLGVKDPLRASPYIHDLHVVPVQAGAEAWDGALAFEFKMAWPGGLAGNAHGLATDLEKLHGHPRGFAAAVFFAFDEAPRWSRYDGGGFELGLAALERAVEEASGATPVFRGVRFPLACDEAEGEAQLLAWRARGGTRA